jgi:hypothetical protein
MNARRIWLAIAFASVSCAGVAREVRRHTYAPSFRYLDEEQIQTAMGHLSRDVVELDRALRGVPRPDDAGWSGALPGPIDVSGRDRIVAILDRMVHTADGIDVRALATNHPELGQGIEAFRRDLVAARAEAAQNAPRHFLAGTITGACLYCHGR